MDQKVHQHWLKPLVHAFAQLDDATLKQTTKQLLVDFSLKPLVNDSSHTAHSPGSRFDATLKTLVGILFWVVGSESFRHIMHQVLVRAGSQVISSVGAIRAQFVRLINTLHDSVNRLLEQQQQQRPPPAQQASARAAGQQFSSLSDLVDEIITLVHEDQRFETIRRSMRSTMDASAGPVQCAYRCFVAQLRECVIAQHIQERAHGRVPNTFGIPGAVSSMSGCWMINMSSAKRQIRDVATSTSTAMLSTLAVVYQLSCVRVVFDMAAVDMQTLAPSAWTQPHSRPTSDHAPSLRLTLDNRLRVFRTFADGLSVLAAAEAGWIAGDYVGRRLSPSVVDVDLYWICTGTTERPHELKTASRVCVRAQMADERGDQLRLTVQVFGGELTKTVGSTFDRITAMESRRLE